MTTSWRQRVTNDELEAIRKRDAADWPTVEALEAVAHHCPDDKELRDAIFMVRDRRTLIREYERVSAELDKACGVLKTMLIADATHNRDLWIKTWAKVPALTAGVKLEAP